MNEKSCRFGDESHLAGIVTEPEVPPGATRGALILASAGLVPKFGPFRLYTEIARRLAREGTVTLRFDLDGIGDSQHAHAGLGLKERTARDMRSAVDFIRAHYDIGDVVLGGLCSGAEDSFRAAEDDARVRGVVMIDPFAYRTAGFMPRHVLHRAVRRTRRALGLYQPIPPARTAASDGGRRVVNYSYMSRDESKRILSALIARRARAHFIYTGGAREVFNHPGQLKAMFGQIDFERLVTVDHFPELEHTQMLESDRRCIVDAVSRRLRWVASESDAPVERASGMVQRRATS
ncbi:MAG TPA: alpha/beta hydrolase [Polyangiaceae bacterium]|nr:alpha/beta hydrolase [Polyangiaceae bacterium]